MLFWNTFSFLTKLNSFFPFVLIISTFLQQKTTPQVDNGNPVIKVEVVDQSVDGNENCDGNITNEEHAEGLQIVVINGAENQVTFLGLKSTNWLIVINNKIHPDEIHFSEYA